MKKMFIAGLTAFNLLITIAAVTDTLRVWNDENCSVYDKILMPTCYLTIMLISFGASIFVIGVLIEDIKRDKRRNGRKDLLDA